MKKSISVVIPNYNGETLLAENLPPLYAALKAAGVPYEIIVSDDASTDNSLAFLETHYPDIILLKAAKNSGFALTINRGIMAARMELVFAMNSDIVLMGDYFTPQFHYFSMRDTFGVGGKIIGLSNDALQDAAKFPQFSLMGGIKGTKNYELTLTPAYAGKNIPSWFLSGANALFDRKKLQSIGGFDPLFSPFYHEDVELGIRAWRLGWRLYYEPAAVCRHPNSATIAAYHKRQRVQIIAGGNALALHHIHLEGVAKGLYFGKMAVKMLGKLLIGKAASYHAFRRYWGLRHAANASRKRLKQQGGTALRSVQAVKNVILTEIRALPIHLF